MGNHSSYVTLEKHNHNVVAKKRGSSWQNRWREIKNVNKKNWSWKFHYKRNIKISKITKHILIEAGVDCLRDLTEDQLETYLYGAQMLTEHQTPSDHINIRQYFLWKDKTDLDPSEEKTGKNG
jgi:hypothetical protein